MGEVSKCTCITLPSNSTDLEACESWEKEERNTSCGLWTDFQPRDQYLRSAAAADFYEGGMCMCVQVGSVIRGNWGGTVCVCGMGGCEQWFVLLKVEAWIG